MGDELARYLAEESRRLEAARDRLIEAARLAIKHSKNAIYAAIRKDEGAAEAALLEAWRAVERLQATLAEAPELAGEEIAQVAEGEAVEAEVVVRFVRGRAIPHPGDLPRRVGFFAYVHGLFDATGELLRAATERLIEGELAFAERAQGAIERVYLLGLELNLKRFDLRRKLDYVGGNLQKLIEFRFQASRKC